MQRLPIARVPRGRNAGRWVAQAAACRMNLFRPRWFHAGLPVSCGRTVCARRGEIGGRSPKVIKGKQALHVRERLSAVSRCPTLSRSHPPNNITAPQIKKPTSEDPLLARHCLVDMVDAEQVMVDDPLDQVEQTEADQERAGEQLGRPSDVPCDGTPATRTSSPSRRRRTWSRGTGHPRRC